MTERPSARTGSAGKSPPKSDDGAGRVGLDQRLRQLFRNEPSGRSAWDPAALPLPIAPVAELAFPVDETTDAAFTLSAAAERPIVEQSLIGLTGVAGVLPADFSFDVLDPDNDDAGASRELLSVIESRFAHLLYSAWYRHQSIFHAERGEPHGVPRYLLDIAGFGSERFLDDYCAANGADAALPRYFASIFGMTARSPWGIETVLEAALGASVQCDSFAGRWVRAAEDYEPILRTRPPLNRDQRAVSLGRGLMCGSYYWDYQQSFTVLVGPLGFDDYFSIITERRTSLLNLVLTLSGPEFRAEIGFSVRAETIRGTVLGDPVSSRLGMSCWILSTPLSEGVAAGASLSTY